MDQFKKEKGEVTHIKADAKFTGLAGVIHCTNQRFLWVQANQIEPTLTFFYREIHTQFVSPATSQTFALKLHIINPAYNGIPVPPKVPPTKKNVIDTDANGEPKFKEYLFELKSRKELETIRDKVAQSPRVGPNQGKPTGNSPPLSGASNSNATNQLKLLQQQQIQQQYQQSQPKQVETYRNGTITEDDIKQRVLLLSSSEELKQLFDSLVGSGTVTENDFWESRRMMLKNESMRSEKQKVGMPSVLLSDVRPTSESSNAITYSLTPQIIKQIFIQHPNVEMAYKENVPIKISAQEFWKRYLESKHFYRDRNRFQKDDLFSKHPVNDDTEIKLLKRKLIDINPLVDISNEQDQDGYGVILDTSQDPEKLKNCLPLLRRFNRHSAMVLGSHDTISSKLKENDKYLTLVEKEKIFNENKKIVNQHIIFEDLEEDKPVNLPKLKIQDQRLYFEGYSSNQDLQNQKDDLLSFWKSDINSWKPNLKSKLSTNNDVFQEVSNVSGLIEKPNIYNLPDDNFKKELLFNFRRGNELLRHFWASSFTPGQGKPPTKAQIEKNNKLSHEIANLYEVLKVKKQKLNEEKKANRVSLITPIQDSLNTAIIKNQETQLILDNNKHHK